MLSRVARCLTSSNAGPCRGKLLALETVTQWYNETSFTTGLLTFIAQALRRRVKGFASFNLIRISLLADYTIDPRILSNNNCLRV